MEVINVKKTAHIFVSIFKMYSRHCIDLSIFSILSLDEFGNLA